MTKSSQPMFKLLLETLKNEPAETKAMFFADTEDNLMRAYQEGAEAHSKKLPISSNPYTKKKDPVDEDGKYTKSLCWGEGFLADFISKP